MVASEASRSSRNQANDVLMLSGNASRTRWHDSHDLVSDASNMPPPASCESVRICSSIGDTDYKNSYPLPWKATSPSVIHSPWIQRLKPSFQSCGRQEDLSARSKKEDVVCTHFTKDYSSCSRRLNKSFHHTRSSSWPPNGDKSMVAMECPREAEEPGHDIAQRHNYEAVNSPDIGYQSDCVPLMNMTQSIGAGSRTGSLFVQQQDCQNQITTREGSIPPAQPSALNAYTLSFGRSKGLQDRGDGDISKPINCFGQQSHIGDMNKVDCAALFEQAKSRGQLQGTQNNWGRFDDSFHTLKNVLSAPRLPVSARRAGCSIGASADADGSICFTKPLSFDVLTSKEIYQTRLGDFGCKVKDPTVVVSSNKGKVNKFALTVPFEKEAVQYGGDLAARTEDAGVPESPNITQNFSFFKMAAVKPSLLNDSSPIGALGDPLHSHAYSQNVRACIEGHIGDAMTAYGNPPSTLITSRVNTQNLASEGRGVPSTRFNLATSQNPYGNPPSTVMTSRVKTQNLASERRGVLPSTRFNLATSQNPYAEERGLVSRSLVSTRSLHEDAARSHAREISLGDYCNSWVQIFKEPDNERLISTGISTIGSQQEFVAGNAYQEFCQQPTMEFEDFSGCRQLNFDSKEIGPCSVGQKRLSLKGQKNLSGSRTNSIRLNQLPDQVPNFGVNYSAFSEAQDLGLHKGSSADRVDSHPHTIIAGRFPDYGSSQTRMHSIYGSPELANNEAGKKEHNIQGRWLQRWQSTEKGSSMAEQPSAFFGGNSRSISSDRLVKLPESSSAIAHNIKESSHKDISPLEGNLIGSGRGSDRYTEASAAHLKTGSAFSPGFLPAVQNFSSFRCGFKGPSVEAMAIAGKSACKLHPRSSQNGGFHRLSSSRHTSSNCVIFSEGGKDADEDKMHLVSLSGHMNDLQGDIDGA